MNHIFGILIFTHFINPLAFGAARPQEVADFLCSEIFGSRNTYNYEEHFSNTFREILTKNDLQMVVEQVVEATGKCFKAETPTPEMSGWYHIDLISESGNQINLRFSLDPDNRDLINGLLIQDVNLLSFPLDTWEELEEKLNSLEGNISLSITNFSQEKMNREISPNEMHPLGSTFKVSVLGALADQIINGKINWEDFFPIRKEWKSLPSGVMQDWEEGKKVSVKDFATHMIQISDNTATDHLIHLIGREEVEKQLFSLGNTFISENIPFLTTSELFKLKWGFPIEFSTSYLNASEISRRNFLDNEVFKLPLDGIINNISEKPTMIKDLEWFGSTEDLCLAMKGLREKNLPEILEILSKNTPNSEAGPNSHWNYIGFKGGSEPGVYTMAYLLQNHDGNWGCVSLAWHNEKKPLNFWVFNDLVKKILKFSEKEI